MGLAVKGISTRWCQWPEMSASPLPSSTTALTFENTISVNEHFLSFYVPEPPSDPSRVETV